MVHLVTARCMLSPPSSGDATALLDLHTDRDVRAHLGGALPEDQAQRAVTRILADETQQHFSVRLNPDRTTIGLLTLGPHHDGQFLELSYMFAPAYWGKGLAFETATIVLNYAFDTLELTEIVAETQSANVASCRLLERLGMERWRRIERFAAAQEIYMLRRAHWSERSGTVMPIPC